MLAIRWTVLAAAVAAFFAIGLTDRAHAAETVKISVPIFNANYAYLFVADDQGYFADEGIAPEFVPLGGGIATPALIGGSLQYSASPASAISAIIKNAPLKVVLVIKKWATERLWSFDPAVTSFADLKGKIIAVTARGATEELSVRTLLKAKNLPSDFVGYTVMGVGATRVAAIIAGSQRYPMLAGRGIEEAQLKQAGYLDKGRILVDFSKEVQLTNDGIATSDAELTDNPARTKRVLRAIWKGVLFMAQNQQGTTQIMRRRFPAVSEQDMADSVAASVEELNLDGTMPVDAASRELAVRAELAGGPSQTVPSFAQVYDFRLLNEVKRELEQSHWQPAR